MLIRCAGPFLSLLLALLLALLLGGPAALAQEDTEAVAPGVRCNSQCVMDLQRQLKMRGLYEGEIDGVAGPPTAEAIKQFQGQRGMEPTGVIDRRALSGLGVQPSGRGAAEVREPAVGGYWEGR